MQNCASGQETEVGAPVYSVGVGRTCRSEDHVVPFQVATEPDVSAATQKVTVGQDTASRPPAGSIV
jgi:hypothetical protein